MSKSVVGDVLQHVSASQITTFSRCARAWYLEKVERIPREQTASQNTGVAIHLEHELHHLEGKVPEHPSLVKALPLLPPRDPQVLVELSLENPTLYAGDLLFKGFIDTLDARDVIYPGIWDLKTTKDFKWNKTPDELQRNVQMVSYAKWAGLKFPEAKKFKLAHVYLKTTAATGAFKIVETDMERGRVDEFFAEIVGTVHQMKDAAKAPTAQDVTPNFNACQDYGGCSYLSICQPSPEQRFRTAMSKHLAAPSENTMSLKERLAANNATATPPPVPTGINPPDANYYPVAAGSTATTVSTPSYDGPAHVILPPAAGEALQLYIDTLPARGVVSFTRLEDLISERAKEVVEEWNANGRKKGEQPVTDVREIGFGVGTAALASSFLQDPPKGVVVAQSGGLASMVIEVLSPRAAIVWRGVR